MISPPKLWVVAFVVIAALVAALFVTWRSPRIEVRTVASEVHVKTTSFMNSSVVTTSISYGGTSLSSGVESLSNVLSPYVLSKLTSFLKEVTGLSGFTYVATVTSRDTNYSVFEVITHNNYSVGKLYYVSWKLISSREVNVLSYGGVRLKEVASNLNNIEPCAIVRCRPNAVLKYLKYLRSNVTVLKFVDVPKPLSNVYVVLMSHRVVIEYSDEVLMNSSIISKFFIAYGSKVLKIEGPIITPYDKRKVSIEIVRRLSSLGAGGVYVMVKVFLKGAMLSIHKVTKIFLALYVDPYLSIGYSGGAESRSINVNIAPIGA